MTKQEKSQRERSERLNGSMTFLTEIDEVTEVTAEETTTNKGGEIVPKSVACLSIEEEECDVCFDSSERSGRSLSKVSKSYMVSIDQDILERISNIDGDSDDGSDMRQANLCCFSCCDLVRACIITNAIFIALMLTLLSLAIYQIPTFHWFDLCQSSFDDDFSYFYMNHDDYFYDDETDDTVDRKSILALVRTGLAIFFSAMGIVGASKFHQRTVLCTAIWYCIFVIWSGLDRIISHAVVGIVFAYPNWHLFFELRRGSITKRDYWRETYCCCECCYGNSDYFDEDEHR